MKCLRGIGLLLLLLISQMVTAQYLYKGENKYGTKLYTWDGEYVYQGSSRYNTKLYYWDGEYVYQGGSKYGPSYIIGMGNVCIRTISMARNYTIGTVHISIKVVTNTATYSIPLPMGMFTPVGINMVHAYTPWMQ